jgi:hypothetical protein
VLRAISDALNLSAETLLAQAGLIDAIAAETDPRTGTAPAKDDSAQDGSSVPGTEQSIRADKRLSEDQKAALLVVYRSMLSQPGEAG